MSFSFSYLLDQKFLESLYEGDLCYAKEVFEGFLTYTRAEFKEIRNNYRDAEIEKIRRGLHKIKPTFGLVGLPVLVEKTEQLITACDKSTHISNIEPGCAVLFKEIEDAFLLIETELERMKNHTP